MKKKLIITVPLELLYKLDQIRGINMPLICRNKFINQILEGWVEDIKKAQAKGGNEDGKPNED